MAQSIKVIIPIICENTSCENFGRTINQVYGIPVDDIDLFYENYDGSVEEDYCPICMDLGVAEDPVIDLGPYEK